VIHCNLHSQVSHFISSTPMYVVIERSDFCHVCAVFRIILQWYTYSSQQNYLLLECHPGSGGKLHCTCVRVINTVDMFAWQFYEHRDIFARIDLHLFFRSHYVGLRKALASSCVDSTAEAECKHKTTGFGSCTCQAVMYHVTVMWWLTAGLCLDSARTCTAIASVYPCFPRIWPVVQRGAICFCIASSY